MYNNKIKVMEGYKLAHCVESMFSANRVVPWHGLGSVIEEAVSSDEALKIAGLDWDVIQSPVYVNDVEVPGYKANVREIDNSVLGIVSDQYKIIQNREAFSFVDELVGHGVKYETAGSLAGGKRVWMLARLPEVKLVDDATVPYLCFSNGHDGRFGVKVMLTPVRVVCQNTLNLAIQTAKRSWSTIHTGNIANKMEDARMTLEMSSLYMKELGNIAKYLVIKKVTPTYLNEFLAELFPVNEDEMGKIKVANTLELRNKVIEIFKNADDLQNYKGTGWGLINAVSDMVTHTKPKRLTATYRENLFDKTVNGHPIIDKAYSILMKKAA